MPSVLDTHGRCLHQERSLEIKQKKKKNLPFYSKGIKPYKHPIISPNSPASQYESQTYSKLKVLLSHQVAWGGTAKPLWVSYSLDIKISEQRSLVIKGWAMTHWETWPQVTASSRDCLGEACSCLGNQLK